MFYTIKYFNILFNKKYLYILENNFLCIEVS